MTTDDEARFQAELEQVIQAALLTGCNKIESVKNLLREQYLLQGYLSPQVTRVKLPRKLKKRYKKRGVTVFNISACLPGNVSTVIISGVIS